MDAVPPIRVAPIAGQKARMDEWFATVRYSPLPADWPRDEHGLPVVDYEPGQDEVE